MSATPETTGTAQPDANGKYPEQRQQPPRPPRHLPETSSEAGRRIPRFVTLAAPAVLYLALQAVGVLVLAAMSAASDEGLLANLRAWDAQWYLEIAANGYGDVDPNLVDGKGNRNPHTALAFFPGFPLLVRVFAVLPGIGVTGAAISASLVAGIVCAYGLARLGRTVSDRIPGRHAGQQDTVGLFLVALFAAAPMSIVLAMPYTEALFCALAAWALVGILERNWLLAGLCCALAGLVRPTAAALVAVVGLAALVALVRGEHGRPLAAMLLAPVGLFGYLGWVALQTGDLNGYFEIQQRGWSSAFDGGAATLRFIGEALTTSTSGFAVMTVWIVLGALLLAALCLRRGMPWPVVLFAMLVLVLSLGSDGLMYSKVRLMLPAFPLLLPLALGLAQTRRTTTVGALVLFIAFGTWFSAYGLAVWPYAI